ncbi:MAG: glycosyltransferase, partial [Myxococcales bacterium]|nr:glycosyltransferase [Myxococcales bacterium]
PAYLAVERDDASNRVAWIGRPIRSKGLPFLVEHATRWQFAWSWSASGFYGDLDQGLLERIPNRLAPCRSRAEMTAFYASTKVVLCPYRNEGFGMVATEAAAAGCRVVGFADGGLLETAVVPHIHLVEPGDVESFNLAVLAALDAGPVSVEDREKVWEAFSPASSGSAYLAHLRRAASPSE